MSCTMKIRDRGFTVVELLVVIAIVAVLAALAAPNFSGMIKANRIQSQARELFSQLQYARSEAVSRSQWVTICPASSMSATTCSGTWSTGWIICLDADRNNSCDAGEQILRRYSDLGSNVLRVVDNAIPAVAQNHLRFNKNGETDPVSNMTFSVCDVDQDVKYARAILKVGAGQILFSAHNASGIYQDVNQAALTCP